MRRPNILLESEQTLQHLAALTIFLCLWALLLGAPAQGKDVGSTKSPTGADQVGEAQVQLTENEEQKDQQVEEVENTDLKEKWGVEVTAIRLTANDHMLDFRYKVHNVEKAAPLFERKTKPHLMHVATGKVIDVPVPAKTGPLRTSNPPKEGRIYWMFFGNAGKLIKRGDEVTVIIGDFRAENLVVE